MVRQRNIPPSSNDNEEYPRTSTPADENVPLNFNGLNASSISGSDGHYEELPDQQNPPNPAQAATDQPDTNAVPDANSSQASTDSRILRNRGGRLPRCVVDINSSQSSDQPDTNAVPEANSSQASTDSSIRPNRDRRLRARVLDSSQSSTEYNNLRRILSGRIIKPKTAAEREIKRLRTTTHPLFKKAPFARVVKEIIEKETGGRRLRISSEAIEALMASAEAILVTLFEASYLVTSLARRTTLKVEDVQHVRKILSMFGVWF